VGQGKPEQRDITKKILDLKKDRNAVILAHLYQRPEIQEIADFVGDSLQLSQQAAGTKADVIVFCGVHFMAESASILSPDKTVLLPEENAGCLMADMITAADLRQAKTALPGAVVVCYVNSSAEIKAESDICCTSSNAVKVVQSLPETSKILFVPDRNLGHYVRSKTGRDIRFWEGHCPTHQKISVRDILAVKEKYPEAKVLVHPECRPDVVDLADAVYSTAGMMKFAADSAASSFIIGTESGLLHQLRKRCPNKRFVLASRNLVCPNMKATTMDKVLRALERMEPRVEVPVEIREKALSSLERMLAVG